MLASVRPLTGRRLGRQDEVLNVRHCLSAPSDKDLNRAMLNRRRVNDTGNQSRAA